MKKAVLILILSLPIGRLMAQKGNQKVNSFQIDIGIGFLSPTFTSFPGSNLKIGGVISLEPKFAITRHWFIGLRGEGGIGVNGTNNNQGSDSASFTPSQGSTFVSGLVTCNYYFTTTPFRPFLGVGAGFMDTHYYKNRFKKQNSNQQIAGLAEMARAGFEMDHFWMDAEYNLAPLLEPGSIRNGYISIKLGLYFGSGKKN